MANYSRRSGGHSLEANQEVIRSSGMRSFTAASAAPFLLIPIVLALFVLIPVSSVSAVGPNPWDGLNLSIEFNRPFSCAQVVDGFLTQVTCDNVSVIALSERFYRGGITYSGEACGCGKITGVKVSGRMIEARLVQDAGVSVSYDRSYYCTGSNGVEGICRGIKPVSADSDTETDCGCGKVEVELYGG